MPDQPTPGGDALLDPFLRLSSLLRSWHSYLVRAFAKTCGCRLAYHLKGGRVGPHVYELMDAEGATEAAREFYEDWYRYRPNTRTEFAESLRAATKLVATAKIPFERCEPVFLEVNSRHDAVQCISVLAPKERRELFPDARIEAVIRLNDIPLNESLACRSLFGRLQAFSDYVSGLELTTGVKASPASGRDASADVAAGRYADCSIEGDTANPAPVDNHDGSAADPSRTAGNNGGEGGTPADLPPGANSAGYPERKCEEEPPCWANLGEAKQVILKVLSKSTERLQGKGIAKAAGYTPGTLRHHFGKLQRWNYIDRTKLGYMITPVGTELMSCESV